MNESDRVAGILHIGAGDKVGICDHIVGSGWSMPSRGLNHAPPSSLQEIFIF